MNASKTAKEHWIVIGIPVVIISAVLIVGGMLSHEPSADECVQKAILTASRDMEKSRRSGEFNEQKLHLAGLRRSEKWFRKAIDKGYVRAHFDLGWRLIIVDRREGLQVLLDGANKGCHKSMYTYAHEAREDGEITEEEAYEWMRRASELGHGAARGILEHSRENGRRIPLDRAVEKYLEMIMQ